MSPHEDRNGIEVARPRYLHLPWFPLFSATRFAEAGLRSIQAERAPEIVVADYAWPASAAVEGVSRLGLPCVISGRGSDVLEVSGEAGLGHHLARFLRLAGHWVAVSRELVERMDQLAGIEGQGVLVPNGVDLELFRPRNRISARSKLEIPVDRTLVLVVGHLIERKDPLLALRVFARGASPEALCVFLGRGPLRDRVELASHELGVADRVRLIGERPAEELASWFNACDCLLLTSRREGRPNVVLEALASGTPVLATIAGGTVEILGQLPRLLSETRDVEELARRLRSILDSPPAASELRASVSHLTWERCAKILENVLTAVVQQHIEKSKETAR